MKYLISMISIFSFVASPALANKSEPAQYYKRKIVNQERRMFIDQLKKENVAISESVTVLESLQEQLEFAEKVQGIGAGARALGPMVAIAAVAVGSGIKKYESLRLGRTIQAVAVLGGLATFATGHFVVKIQREKIEDLSLEIADQIAELEQEYGANMMAMNLIRNQKDVQ